MTISCKINSVILPLLSFLHETSFNFIFLLVVASLRRKSLDVSVETIVVPLFPTIFMTASSEANNFDTFSISSILHSRVFEVLVSCSRLFI